MTKRRSKKGAALDGVTRRDFIGAALIGAGSALLGAEAPLRGALAAPAETARAKLPDAQLGPDWTGPGGIGDYATSNGNIYSTVNTAHALRDGDWRSVPAAVPDSTQPYDLVIVGGGISGLMSAYEFLKLRGRSAKVLLLDNHPIFGGEAKQNELEIDGYRLQAPQGSNMFLWPPKKAAEISTFWHPVWQELGLPMGDSPKDPEWLTTPTGGGDHLTFAKDNYSPMMIYRLKSQQVQFVPDPKRSDHWIGIKNPWERDYQDLPWPDEAKRELVRLDNHILESPPKDLERWLDGMTYKDYLARFVGVTRKEVFDYLDPMVAAHGPGLGCDVISALAASNFRCPGLATSPPPTGKPLLQPVSFPGGNTGIARHFVKRLLPDAISGGENLQGIFYGTINWASLDRPNQPLRMRLNVTAVDVRHDGPANSAGRVIIAYIDNRTGKPHEVYGKSVVVAGGQWVNKYIVRDAPADLRTAMDQFNHAPMLVVNVGVRHWRFMEKMGVSSARWLGGLGWFTNVRAPMALDGQHMPFDPDKPAILTFYNPFSTFAPSVLGAGMPLRAQCVAARTALLGLAYRDIETSIRQQLAGAFEDYGFDHKRDIAALIANRWGHAYVVPQPGFFFAKDGAETARDVVRRGFGRVRFAHSELSGDQIWSTACGEGERAARQVSEFA